MLVCSRKWQFAAEDARLSRTFHEKFNLRDSIAARQPDVTCQLTPDVWEICAKMRIASETDLSHVVR